MANTDADALREALWNDALDSFEEIIGDEMEPAKEQA